MIRQIRRSGCRAGRGPRDVCRMAARELAAQRVAWLTGWVNRARDVLAAYTDSDRCGRAVGPGGGTAR